MTVFAFGYADQLGAEVLLLRTVLGKGHRRARDFQHDSRSRRQMPLDSQKGTADADVQRGRELNELFTTWLDPTYEYGYSQRQSFPATTLFAALSRFHPC